jgi:hypothetical protein
MFDTNKIESALFQAVCDRHRATKKQLEIMGEHPDTYKRLAAYRDIRLEWERVYGEALGLAKALSCITGISAFRFMKAASDIYNIVY